jgi:hypothetical protein
VPPCAPMPIAVPWGAKRHDFKLVVIRVKSVVACPLKAVFDGEVPSPGHRHGQPSVRAEDGPSSGPSSTRSSASGKPPGSVGEATRAVDVCLGGGGREGASSLLHGFVRPVGAGEVAVFARSSEARGTPVGARFMVP